MTEFVCPYRRRTACAHAEPSLRIAIKAHSAKTMKRSQPNRLLASLRSLIVAVLPVVGLSMSTGVATGQQLLLSNPHWNITLSDFGYSDYMLDNTPGFEGREYLSGEWAAAVAYQVSGQPAVTPQWLERYFTFPDWTNNSTFAPSPPRSSGSVPPRGSRSRPPGPGRY